MNPNQTAFNTATSPSPTAAPDAQTGVNAEHGSLAGVGLNPPAGLDRGTVSAPGELTAEMNAEIDAAMHEMDQAGAAEARATAAAAAAPAARQAARPAGIRGPRVVQAGREHRTGKVVSVGPTDIFVEFGPKELGVVSRLQYPDENLPVVGGPLEVVIDRFEASEGLFLCSRPGSVQKADWELLEAGQVIEARVTSVVKGGLELEVAGHRAFMPASQVSAERIEDLSIFIGEKLRCTVSRVERMGKGNIVLSRRDVIDAEREQMAERLKSSLTEGQTIEGTVRKIMPFGAFVDIGGIDGLIHISDLTYDRVGFGEKAVSKHVAEGQKVTVRIMKLDWENKRISLGLKQTQGDPFATAVNAITEGAEVTGRVTKIMEFGAFIEIGPGVEGLAHISELDHKRVAKVDDVVKQDEVVRAKVLKIDADTRRISLSLKALKPLPEIKIGEGGPQPGQGGGFGGGGGGGGGGMGGGGRSGGKPGGRRDAREVGRSADEIMKETPALRRLREQFKNKGLKGGMM